MDQDDELKVKFDGKSYHQGLQCGYTIDEMTDRVEGLLKSIGLTKNFASIIYVIGHGASSVNNTHYAGYDCGACSGRPGSVNANVFAAMANNKEVRNQLNLRGIKIPYYVHFIAGLHDTTRDLITFYKEDDIDESLRKKHQHYKLIFRDTLIKNAKERSRRFELTNSKNIDKKVHEKVEKRAYSFFEPRPELNHATNALCIVGKRALTKDLFLDRRAFLNSYQPSLDGNTNYLQSILNAVTPVCGGINLEYYFSRVDNNQLGAGSKLPHNVVGLLGVANGVDGDLLTGLPKQMIEVHDPLRLMMIVDEQPALLLQAIQQNSKTFEWYKNEWVHLCAVHPETSEIFKFNAQIENFEAYTPFEFFTETKDQLEEIFELESENLPVFILQNSNI
jgi:uncharacterized protein YbcC (UPF0753/DUF2309 family)